MGENQQEANIQSKGENENRFVYLEDEKLKNFLNSLVEGRVIELKNKMCALEPEAVVERSVESKKMSEAKKNQLFYKPLFEKRLALKQVSNELARLEKRNTSKVFVGTGTNVSKKLGNRIVRELKKHNMVKYVWINPSCVHETILNCFDTEKQRKFNSLTEIEDYFALLLGCNRCLNVQDLDIFLTKYPSVDKSLFVDDGQVKYFDLKFKIYLYDFNLMNGNYTDGFTIELQKKSPFNTQLVKSTQVKYSIENILLQCVYKKLLREIKKENRNSGVLFLVNCSALSLNKKLNCSLLEHKELVD